MVLFESTSLLSGSMSDHVSVAGTTTPSSTSRCQASSSVVRGLSTATGLPRSVTVKVEPVFTLAR